AGAWAMVAGSWRERLIHPLTTAADANPASSENQRGRKVMRVTGSVRLRSARARCSARCRQSRHEPEDIVDLIVPRVAAHDPLAFVGEPAAQRRIVQQPF